VLQIVPFGYYFGNYYYKRTLLVVSVLPMILQSPKHMLRAYPPKSGWFFPFNLPSVDDSEGNMP
jgi:hypothetical protein